MTPTEYQAAAARTLPTDLSGRDRLSMLALGVVGEWAEYQAAKDTPTESEEAGDVLWYIAGLCTVLRVDLADLASYRVAPAPAMDALGDVCEPIKKHLYHGKDLDKARVLGGCCRLYRDIARRLMLPDVMAANVAKLQARWPDGFRVQA
jgi:NTP pyrophosphatase (non-canonical NTP hydrolase)